MYILVVNLKIKEDRIEDFKEASFKNARGSRTEPGIISFDLLQDKEDPSRFVLYEVYINEDGPVSHRETAHYKAWKSVVGDMYAEPATRGIYDYAEKV